RNSSGAPMRAQGCFLSDKEIQKVVRFWRGQYDGATPESLPTANPSLADGAANGAEAALPTGQITWDEARALDQAAKDAVSSGGDKLFDEAVATVRMHGKASISLLQRRLRIGYTRSARIIEEMEEKGIVGPQTAGSQFREVLPPK
ncbi:MAG TPA: DNA translocase FtsK, partial [Thermoflexales bacterium]|nr:DNA translocase FtsK [Thermoflexales bacterium]